MKFEKLKSITKKRKTFSKFEFITLIIMLLIPVFLLIVTLLNRHSTKLEFPILLIFVVLYGCATILAYKERNYRINEYDYICVKIRDIINEFGFEGEKYEMIAEDGTGIIYIVFHSKAIDYAKLVQILNIEIDNMNKITGRNVQVKVR